MDQEKYKQSSTLTTKEIILNNFLGGLSWGLGTVIGATVLIGILGIIITNTQNIPLIGNVTEVVLQEISQGRENLQDDLSE